MEHDTWGPDAAGVLRLPSGRRIRGRGLRDPLPAGPVPDVGLYLLGEQPDPFPWETQWLPWRDFRVPSDPARAYDALHEIWRRAEGERVEVACHGGRGRTGTALACFAVLDGVPATEAVTFVRRSYHPRAVETPWQRRFVRRLGRASCSEHGPG